MFARDIFNVKIEESDETWKQERTRGAEVEGIKIDVRGSYSIRP